MIFVSGISSRYVASGLTFVVYGGFFDASCVVRFGAVSAVTDSYSDDMVTVVVPDVTGPQQVTIYDGEGRGIDLGYVTVGDLSSVAVHNYARDYSLDDFESLSEGLFPNGWLFDFETGSNWRKLITAISYALLYLWSIVRGILQALNPLKTENLDEWERELGLPEIGINPETTDERRREIYRVGFSKGGCSINYYRRILNLMGVNADIYEYAYNPEKFAGIDFGGDDPRFYMMIRFRVNSLDYVYFRAGVGAAGDRVVDFDNKYIESIFERVKQAHVKIIYAYSVRQGTLIITSGNQYVITIDGNRLAALIDS